MQCRTSRLHHFPNEPKHKTKLQSLDHALLHHRPSAILKPQLQTGLVRKHFLKDTLKRHIIEFSEAKSRWSKIRGKLTNEVEVVSNTSMTKLVEYFRIFPTTPPSGLVKRLHRKRDILNATII